MVQQIDFLPASYRQNRQRRQKKLSRRIILLIFLGMVVLGTYQQRRTQSDLQARRDKLQNQAKRLTSRVGDKPAAEKEIRQQDFKANLIALLQIRVPPTRLLAAVTNCLPKYVTLTQCQTSYDSYLATAAEKSDSKKKHKKAVNKSKDKPLPEQMDLERLKSDDQKTALFVTLHGIAPNDVAVWSYLAALKKTNVFEDVEQPVIDRHQYLDFELRKFEFRLRVKKPGRSAKPLKSGDPLPTQKTASRQPVATIAE